jgi:hypothetical protein
MSQRLKISPESLPKNTALAKQVRARGSRRAAAGATRGEASPAQPRHWRRGQRRLRADPAHSTCHTPPVTR